LYSYEWRRREDLWATRPYMRCKVVLLQIGLRLLLIGCYLVLRVLQIMLPRYCPNKTLEAQEAYYLVWYKLCRQWMHTFCMKYGASDGPLRLLLLKALAAADLATILLRMAYPRYIKWCTWYLLTMGHAPYKNTTPSTTGYAVLKHAKIWWERSKRRDIWIMRKLICECQHYCVYHQAHAGWGSTTNGRLTDKNKAYYDYCPYQEEQKSSESYMIETTYHPPTFWYVRRAYYWYQLNCKQVNWQPFDASSSDMHGLNGTLRTWCIYLIIQETKEDKQSDTSKPKGWGQIAKRPTMATDSIKT